MENLEERKEREEGINLERLWLMVLTHWYWFVGCVLIAGGIGFYQILRTTPIFTRSSQLLIKDEDKGGGSSAILQEFKDLGFGGSISNIENEILTLSAPIMMEHVVKRLNLDMDLSTKEGLRVRPLYYDSPLKVSFEAIPNQDAYISFKIALKDKQNAVISELVYDKEEFEEKIDAKIDGGYVKTPVGTIKIEKTPAWDDEFVGKDITVNKYPLKAISDYYSKGLSVAKSNKEATVLNLSINDAIPQRADDVLNTLVEIYNENWIKDKNRIAESTAKFINDRLESITKELGDVDSDISKFKSDNLLPDIQASVQKDMLQSSNNYAQLLELNNQLSMTLFVKDYLADKSKQHELLPSNTGIPSPGVEKMIDGYNTMMLERNSVLTNTTENSPVLRDLDNKLASQKSAILRSLDNLVAQIKKQINGVERSERQINSQIATAPRQVKELQSVERQQKVKEALYIFLLQKREENELSRTYTAWNTSIIQPPTGSEFPTSPKKPMIMLIAIILGLAIPGGILFLNETMNHKVRGRKDLEGMSVPLVGEIPNIAGKRHFWQKKKNARRAIVVEADNKNIINESFRIVRTKLDYYIKSVKDQKVIMFTSFNPGSGKSFITGNLAKTFGLNGKRILTIDMDIRHTSLTGMMDHRPHHGLTTYLSDSESQLSDLDKLVVKDGLGKNVDVLPVGVIPPNPTELLYSEKIGPMMEKFKGEYDYIFLDCPPIEIVADASIIKDYADVSIFVVRAGLMDRRVLGDVDELYKENKYNRLAILLNGTDYISGKYGQYRYGYGYGYGYGYAEGYHDKD